MKSLIFLALLFGAQAWAARPKKVQFELELELDLAYCPTKDKKSCPFSDGSRALVRQTVIAGSTADDPVPQFKKTFTIKRGDGTAPVTVVASMNFDHWEFQGMTPVYVLDVRLDTPEMDRIPVPVDSRGTVITMTELTGFDGVLTQGRVELHRKKNGTFYALMPEMIVSKIKILE